MKESEKLQEKPWEQEYLYKTGTEARILARAQAFQLSQEAENGHLQLGS